MNRWLTERLCRRAFDDLNAGRIDSLLRKCRSDVAHRFAGDHALGGRRYSVEGLQRWFDRLHHLFPELQFTIHDVLVTGGPRDTRVVIRWTDTGMMRTGETYENRGIHYLRLRWGRVALIEAHLDTQVVERACERMAAQGVTEAQAAPIEDSV